MSLDLAKSCQNFVTTLVHADDWVPRLSVLALLKLEKETRHSEQRFNWMQFGRHGNFFAKIFQPHLVKFRSAILNKKVADGDKNEKTKKFSYSPKTSREVRSYLYPLHPAGRVFLLPQQRNKNASNQNVNQLERLCLTTVPHEHFLTMRITKFMFGDHKIAYYRRAVQSLLN